MYYLICIRASLPANAIDSFSEFDAAAVCDTPPWLENGLPMPNNYFREVHGREVVALSTLKDFDEACSKLDMLFPARSEATHSVNPFDCLVPLILPDTILAGRRALPPAKLNATGTAFYVQTAARDTDLSAMTDHDLVNFDNWLHAEAEWKGLLLDPVTSIRALEKMRAGHLI
ncbi:MAG: hypothetical protein ABJG14_17655 [Sulfitobacter sp.]|uniref:hypothetical protein n=1 Tax=Alphaproteobacteria TaxID=28211 RepID=UPI0032674EED